MGSEKFCLRWNDFETNISSAFRDLREDKDFFDVTLACDDEQIQAHKVILSACSPFFRNILHQNPHPHPLLYLKGVKFLDIQAVLNFMYHGEVNVAQEELNTFLAVAEDLRVKGLTQNQSDPQTKTISAPKSQSQSLPKTIMPRNTEKTPSAQPLMRPKPITPVSTLSREVDDDIVEYIPVKSEPRDPPPQVQLHSDPIYTPPISNQANLALSTQDGHENDMVYQETESYDDYSQYSGEERYSGLGDGAGGDANKAIDDQVAELTRKTGTNIWECLACGKTASQRTDLKKHIEAHHLNLCLPCDQCESVFSSRHVRQHHIRNMH